MTAVAAVATVTLAACTGNAAESSDTPKNRTPGARASASVSASPAAQRVEPSAHVGDCFDTNSNFAFTDVPEPIPCDKGKYTEQTIAVYDLPEALALTYPERQELADAADSGIAPTPAEEASIKSFATQTKALYDRCEDDVRSSVSEHTNRVSLFGADVTGPNQAQWDAGERWARCNVALRLPPDAKRKADRLLPLPTQLSNAANLYIYQSCFGGSDKKPIVHQCDSPFFSHGAWLKTLEGLPISNLGQYPGTEVKALKTLARSCLALTKPYVQPSANLTVRDVFVSARAPNWVGSASPGWKDVWEDPDGFYRCSIPNWAYIGAPPV